ncbi:MAG: hypothetical protein ACOX9C_06490 [Kiritimatiellia bacterium]|jgi:hypothetical protein
MKTTPVLKPPAQAHASPLFLLGFCLLVLLSAPLWIPLAMCASLATGRSLRELNEAADAPSP